MYLELKRRRITEGNVQAEFYHHCRLLQIPCYLEYTHENCRFDAVIFDNITMKVLIIIEFKNKIKEKPNYKTKQIKKYSTHDLPVLLIHKTSNIYEGILKVLRILWKKSDSLEYREQIAKLAENYKTNKDLTIHILETRLINNYERNNVSYKNDYL